MNIVITSHRFSPDIGGIESITQVLAYFFVEQGHSVRVVTGSVANRSDDKYPFEVHRCPSFNELLRVYYWSDVIFQNNLEVRRLWPLVIIRKPVVIGLQTWIRSTEFKRLFIHFVKIQFLRLATRIIACSEAVRKDSYSKAFVIGNPYDENLFRILPDVKRSKSIVFLGRLVSDKGADMLLKAFSSLRNRDWTLTIVGDGPQKGYLKNLSLKYNIRSKVHFTGFLKGNSLVEELNGHEIMVVPSRWHEPFGVVALEGMACGCAMLVSDGGGLSDAVGLAGLKFKRENQTDLNEKLQLLVEDATLRQKLRMNSPKHLSNHTVNSVGHNYLSIFKDVSAHCN